VGSRGVSLDAEISADFSLHKGVNVIMLKVENGVGDWGGAARLTDGDDHPLPISPSSPRRKAKRPRTTLAGEPR